MYPARSVALSMVVIALLGSNASAQEPVNIGSRLELLVDDTLIEEMAGGANLRLHHPQRRDIVFQTDAPWEGNASAYQSVFKDGDLYRMYYRGTHYRHSGEPAQALEDHAWYLCYAESDDGIHWRRPELGIVEFDGSTANNIVLSPEMLAQIGGDPAHTATFLDENPDCPPDEKYKIIILGSKPTGLYVLKSADGVHFAPMGTEPVITEGAFDSQNLAFWDPVRQEYREYHRGFNKGMRDIMTTTSTDFRTFGDPDWIQYPGAPAQQLYTNQIQPYYRAPHIFMGFPMRYTDRGWSQPVLDLPGLDERLVRGKSHPRYATTVTDAVFMTSRDGVNFNRWAEAFIRPGPRERRSWVYGDNFVFWGMAETRADVEDAPNEISLYATEGYWEGVATDVRRYTIRVDGFVSANAPFSGGEVVTKPLIFEGGNLAVNLETGGAGSFQVEIQDAGGNPIDGYTLDECPPIFCDRLRHIVRWEHQGGDLRPLAGTPVRLRFVLSDADLYAFQFVPYEPEPEYPDVVGIGAMPRKNRDRAAFVVLQDDFTGMPAGTTPSEEDLNPAVVEGQSGWLIREGSPDRVQVLNDDPIGSGQAGDRPYLKIERRAESHEEGGCAWVALTPQDAADTTRGTMEINARIWVPSTNASRVEIDGYDNPVGTFDRRAFHVRFAADGTVTYYKDIENPITDLSFQTDTWQEVTIRADLDTATFDLTIGDKTVQALPFALGGVKRVQCIAIGPNSGNSVIYVERVQVTVTP